MATIHNVSNTLFDSILPTFGNPGSNLPVWNEGQKMFISSEYESAAGHRYYKGLRFCEQLAIIETLGLYHTWTYIDGIEIYAFDGRKAKLVGKRQFEKTFYDEAFIREQTTQMVKEYMQGQCKLQNVNLPAVRLEEQAKSVVNRSYTSFLSDDFDKGKKEILIELLRSNSNQKLIANS